MRLGIPLLFGFDVIHEFRTISPIPLGETASWEPQLIQEDTYLNSVMAAARTRGFQDGDLSDHQTVMATEKHFAAYGAPEGGRTTQ